MGELPLRLAVVGDELVAGAGDPKALGWVGRVAARTPTPDPLTVLTLAVPGETTTALGARWDDEVSRRLSPEADNRLVVALGRADVAAGLSLARSRLNLANILDVAEQRRIPTFVVGPPPGGTADADTLADLSAAFADVATRRRVPFVDTYTPLAAHDQWLGDLAAGDGVLPGQAGYGLMAWLVLHTGWHTWLGLPDDS
ncbi:GDSL-type esterase/lipase family protein [Cellulomonas fengjieae]|uniref:Lysophospholipase n=1 Tax=Cellulomonas fengjieae TaxID=2819978 RepID=A0ABS3SGB0_9CELL|nr:GDSL-type esterase/lipase family protein [Cellulomonas fengjieae]MBO3084790.1 lysophospholipase [Cellulomonas fengjieae]MBO3103756.1 lysophospholipase [Cellulomonas fengjieae]QVI66893.1 lysophospholipase [Cellulomonas fengjieae]